MAEPLVLDLGVEAGGGIVNAASTTSPGLQLHTMRFKTRPWRSTSDRMIQL